jgi:hypothetical protein
MWGFFPYPHLTLRSIRGKENVKKMMGATMKAVLWFCISFAVLLLTVSWLAGISESL